jgi:type IV pilus assembly protein PilX
MYSRILNYDAARQEGAALITALVMLVILTLLGLSSISTSTMEERMAANAQEINRAFQAASTGLEIAFTDETAFDTSLTVESDGTADDKYVKSNTGVGGTGSYAYNATSNYNSVFRQMTVPPRGSGWDSSYGYYHFQLSSTGTTDSGASSTVNAGAYQIGKAQ